MDMDILLYVVVGAAIAWLSVLLGSALATQKDKEPK